MGHKRRRLTERRRALGYSQEQLAELLRVERSTVGRWERAETDPLPYVRPRLAHLLQITPEELADLLKDVEPSQPNGSEPLAYALNDPAAVDLVTAGHLRQRVQTMSDSYDRVQSALLLAAAGQCHGQVSYLRQNARSSRIRHELFSVEAESATLMGQLVWDASQRQDHATSLKYFDEAIAAARQIHDRFTESHAQLRKSYVALYGVGDPVGGLTLASVAAQTAAETSPSLAGIALMHVAEARAMLRENDRCQEALEAAQAEFTRVGEARPCGRLLHSRRPCQAHRLVLSLP